MSQLATVPFDQLVAEGRLVPARIFCPPLPSHEISEPGFSGLNAIVVDPYSKYCPGKKAVVFCATVQHAEALAASFTAAGVPAAAVLGCYNRAERTANIERFQSGDLLVLTTVHVLLESPMPETDAVIIAAPTRSPTMFRQMMAASVRPRFPAGMPRDTAQQRLAAIAASDKTEAIVLDLAGNCLRHGFADL